MTKIRDMLRKGLTPPREMIREDIAQLLMEYNALREVIRDD